jgi:hypothetical protein
VSRTRLLVVGSIVAVLLVAFGAVAALTRDPKKQPFVLPKCALPAHAIDPPAPFPRTLPLPKGTVFSTVARYPNVIVVTGRTPLELLAATRFFVFALPRKSFRLGPGESEPGFEAEGGFTGHGIVGRFKVRALPRCRGAALLVVSISRAGPPIPDTSPVRGSLPPCAGAGRSVASGLPASFPMLKETVIRARHKQVIAGHAFDFVSAVAPGSIDDAAKFIRTKLPRAGYRLAEADRESTEAEAAFVGHGIQGRVRFHTLLGCPAVLTVDIATTRR